MCRRGALAGIWRERAACSPAGGVNTMFPSDARGRRLAVRVSQARAQPSHGGGGGRVRPFCCVCAGGGVRHRKDQGVEAPWLPPPFTVPGSLVPRARGSFRFQVHAKSVVQPHYISGHVRTGAFQTVGVDSSRGYRACPRDASDAPPRPARCCSSREPGAVEHGTIASRIWSHR